MAKSHLIKCLYCGQIFDTDKEEFVKPNSRRYAHKKCAEDFESKKTKEEKDKEELEKYILQLFGISSISPKIKKQIKDFHEKNNFTYSGIHKTLKYFFEIKGNSIDKANGGIGIVLYTYDQASLYYRALWEARQKNENIEISQYVLPERKINITIPERKIMVPRKKFSFLEEGEK